MTALVSFERVFEVLDLKPMVKDPERPKTIPTTALSVEFNDVRFRYPRADEISLASLESAARSDLVESGEVLKGLSFSIPAGTMTALVGPSGAGKTTVSALIPRLYDVTSGVIKVGGIDLREIALQELRDAIGVVAQDPHLFHETIAANLRYAKPDANEDEMRQACAAAQIIDLIDSLPQGFETVVGERGHRLSGGEKQRLAIARVLLKRPRIVILDEATAHLDSENERLVHGALTEALAGRTSIVIAHRLSTVKAADQILVLAEGKIVEQGRHDQLIASGGLYAELVAKQSFQ
jgi:ATP-binding cassette subfamily B protein